MENFQQYPKLRIILELKVSPNLTLLTGVFFFVFTKSSLYFFMVLFSLSTAPQFSSVSKMRKGFLTLLLLYFISLLLHFTLFAPEEIFAFITCMQLQRRYSAFHYRLSFISFHFTPFIVHLTLSIFSTNYSFS